MAFDTVIDKAQLEGAITASANAIREKTGSTEKIVWDATKGYADAISAIEAGGGTVSADLDAFMKNELTEVTSNVSTVYAYSCYYRNKLQKANFHKAVIIQHHAFAQCWKLAEWNFPRASTLYQNCFESTPLTAKNVIADFPSVKTIKKEVFLDSALAGIILRNDTVVTLEDASAFYCELPYVGYIYVPAALVESYKVATNWSLVYAEYVEWGGQDGDLFRPLESYTVDGTTTGALDPNKI